MFSPHQNFFLFARRYSDASCSQVYRKLAAGRKLLHGLIQVGSEFRLCGWDIIRRARGEIGFRGSFVVPWGIGCFQNFPSYILDN